MKQSNNIRQWLVPALYAIVALAFLGFYLITPCGNDDYCFLGDVRLFSVQPDGSTDLCDGIITTWIHHAGYDNARIAQLLIPALLQLPRRISASMSWVAFTVMLWMLTALAPRVRRSLPWSAVFMAVFVCLVPWHMSMFCTSYQYNYTWPGMLAALCAVLYCGRRRSPWLTFILGLTTGLWHEAFGIAVSGGAFLPMLRPGLRRADRAAMWLGATLGVAVLYFAVPGTDARMDMSFVISPATLRFYPLTLVSILLWVIAVWRRQSRARAMSPEVLFPLCAMLPVMATNIFFEIGRISFAAVIFAAPVIVTLLGALTERLKLPRRAIYIAAAAVWLFIMAHLAVAMVYTVRLNREMARHVQLYKLTDRSGEFFDDFTLPRDVHWMALRKPDFTMAIAPYFHKLMARYYDRDAYAMIPASLRDYRGEGVPVDTVYGFKVIDGVLVAPDTDRLPVNEIDATVDYGDHRAVCELALSRFTGGDGRRYVMAIDMRSAIALNCGDVVNIIFE